MGYWLCGARAGQMEGVLTRFDPRFWVVNFPRPAMASVVATAADGLRVETAFHRRGDLVGLIWEAEDRHDHPLLAYETARDFRGCRLRFRWRSGGIRALDAVNGPTLTIEGRDAGGQPRAWYVRLWNYAVGDPEDAVVAIDFAALDGGFLLPGEADPVWAGDVDRMFVSLVAPGYDGSETPLAAPAEGWAEMRDIACDGPGAVLAIGDAVLPEHGRGIAGGYDDSYHLTPDRLLRNALHLGYRGAIVHYLGMSHYPRLARDGPGDGWRATLAGGVLNGPCAAWQASFAAVAKRLGYDVIWSLSYELFDVYCPDGWKQRAADGTPALTGWVPPSTLLSPANAEAMAYLQGVAAALMDIALAAGLVPRFQIGEPWWWVLHDGRPCLYDAAAVAAFAPGPVASVASALSRGERGTLDRAGACLAASTAALAAAARGAAATCELLLLVYQPSVLDPQAPDVRRANLPAEWAWPAFDVLQVEDYDWAAAGDAPATADGIAAVEARLGYPPGRQHHLAGFVAAPALAAQWAAIDAAAATARARGVAAVVMWALPQVCRDGYVHFDDGEDAVDGFDDVLFPLAIGREAEVTPEHLTQIVTGAGGGEARNAGWASARTRYDVGPGVRDEADIAALLAFFRARLGPARAFRLRDPFDWQGGDEAIGIGDGATRRFALVRRYDAVERRITRPVAGSVTVRIDGAVAGFAPQSGGWVVLDTVPAAGAAVTADFAFDVPVRFAEDRLSVTLAHFRAGIAASVPLVEVREA